jgi:hypothetical protein
MSVHNPQIAKCTTLNSPVRPLLVQHTMTTVPAADRLAALERYVLIAVAAFVVDGAGVGVDDGGVGRGGLGWVVLLGRHGCACRRSGSGTGVWEVGVGELEGWLGSGSWRTVCCECKAAVRKVWVGTCVGQGYWLGELVVIDKRGRGTMGGRIYTHFLTTFSSYRYNYYLMRSDPKRDLLSKSWLGPKSKGLRIDYDSWRTSWTLVILSSHSDAS